MKSKRINRPSKPIPLEVLVNVSARIANGETVVNTAKELGLSGNGLKHKLIIHGLYTGSKWNKLSNSIVETAIARIMSGEVVASVAESLGVDGATLHKHMRRRGVPAVGKFSRVTYVKMPEDVASLAYIAGLFDGKGCISSFLCKSQNNSVRYTVGIDMTYADVIYWIAGFTGTNVYSRQRACPKHTDVLAKRSYSTYVGKLRDVVAFLEPIVPYLRVKKGKALECLAYVKGRLAIQDGNS